MVSLLNDTETQMHFSSSVSDLYGKNIQSFDMKSLSLCRLSGIRLSAMRESIGFVALEAYSDAR